VLAHQSTLLLQGLNNENQEEFLLLLQDVEQLKRSLEDERNKHEEEISLLQVGENRDWRPVCIDDFLQEKLEMAEKNSHLEVVEERLKLAESELQAALERAEKAEEALERAEKAEDALHEASGAAATSSTVPRQQRAPGGSVEGEEAIESQHRGACGCHRCKR
jgi:hypothetical protein